MLQNRQATRANRASRASRAEPSRADLLLGEARAGISCGSGDFAMSEQNKSIDVVLTIEGEKLLSYYIKVYEVQMKLKERNLTKRLHIMIHQETVPVLRTPIPSLPSILPANFRVQCSFHQIHSQHHSHPHHFLIPKQIRAERPEGSKQTEGNLKQQQIGARY